MAYTEFGTNDDKTVKIWSTLTIREALKATQLVGGDKNNYTLKWYEKILATLLFDGWLAVGAVLITWLCLIFVLMRW